MSRNIIITTYSCDDTPPRSLLLQARSYKFEKKMPSRGPRPTRPTMFNTPTIRTGGFGALQVEAITNRPLSIARRHLAASQLRMRDIEPDELSSSEWVRFLVMEERERERWMAEFTRRRRNSSSSTGSAESSRDGASYDKAEEARQEARSGSDGEPYTGPSARTPAVSLWVRQFDEGSGTSANQYSARRPMHTRRGVMDTLVEAPPTYETAVRPPTPPPAYEPRVD